MLSLCWDLLLYVHAKYGSLYELVYNDICISETKPSFKMPKKANIFESFSHSAIQQFKEAFGIMDTDKDGLLSSSDLQAAFAAHGKNIGGGEAQVILTRKDVKTWNRMGLSCAKPSVLRLYNLISPSQFQPISVTAKC